ncbi:MAG TPA: NAD-dependent epimerase/dehydratase family protein [Steroidobacter sp.]|nr:NAD-dependent epimerase/dehydratase family protein [Steroidobacteraceae bacterium]HLS80513.1 NAD-dependent epimerase/dehydratase family protein [Steroidobacter sp.]
MRKKIVIAGASGLVGGAAVRLFASRGDWQVVAVSRRAPLDVGAHVQHVSVDLCDAQACAQAFGAMSDVTHLIYAAVSEKTEDIYGGWSDPAQIAKNTAMLRNLFEPLSSAARDLQHVALVHGAKAYGCHLPQVAAPIPMRESLPRPSIPNFYFEQEDYIWGKQQGQSWTWTVWRPVGVAGVALGSPMNSFLMLPLYAALRREAGLDLPMPAGVTLASEATDADLIAEALEWGAQSPNARNEIFNISNGDVVAQRERFPVIAEHFGMPLGEPRRINVSREVVEMAGLWREMVRRYELQAPEDVAALFGGSLTMSGVGTEAPEGNPLRWGLVSTIKLRRAGFHGCADTLEMVRKYARRYQELRILPH